MQLMWSADRTSSATSLAYVYLAWIAQSIGDTILPGPIAPKMPNNVALVLTGK